MFWFCRHVYYIALLLVIIVQTMSSSHLWSHNTPLLLWQLPFWKSNNENIHSFLVKEFYSWREAGERASYHKTHSQYAPCFYIICYLLVRAGFSSAVNFLVFCQASEWPEWWYSLGYNFTAEYILLEWSFPGTQGEFPVSSFQLASPVCFVCHPKWFLSSLSVCTLQMFADSYHIISPFPHPHPGLLAKLYIFSSFNLSS